MYGQCQAKPTCSCHEGMFGLSECFRIVRGWGVSCVSTIRLVVHHIYTTYAVRQCRYVSQVLYTSQEPVTLLLTLNRMGTLSIMHREIQPQNLAKWTVLLLVLVVFDYHSLLDTFCYDRGPKMLTCSIRWSTRVFRLSMRCVLKPAISSTDASNTT